MIWVWALSRFSHVLLFQPYGLKPARLFCSWDSPGKNTRVGCHALLQGIFLTQGSKPCLLRIPVFTGRFFTTSANWEARGMMYILQNEVAKVLTHEVNCRARIHSQPGLFSITSLSLSPHVGPLYRLEWRAEVATGPFHRALPLCPGQTERRCLLKGCLTYFMDFLRIIFIIFYF